MKVPVKIIVEHIRTAAGARFATYTDDEDRRVQLIQYFNEVHADPADCSADLADDTSLDDVIECIEEIEDVSSEEIWFDLDVPLHICVLMSGGLVHDVRATHEDVKLTVVDYDTEGGEFKEMYSVPDSLGDGGVAFVSAQMVDRDPDFVQKIVDAERVRVAECANCEWYGPEEELLPIKDIGQRVEAGEPMPAGECPQCFCLAHLRETEEELLEKADQKHNATMLDGCETDDERNAELRAQTQGR